VAVAATHQPVSSVIFLSLVIKQLPVTSFYSRRLAGMLPAQACGNDFDEDGHGTHVAGQPAVVLNALCACTPTL